MLFIPHCNKQRLSRRNDELGLGQCEILIIFIVSEHKIHTLEPSEIHNYKLICSKTYNSLSSI